jgi:hypothetical protein
MLCAPFVTSLLAVIASAHALIGGSSAAGAITGLNLDRVQRTVIAVSAMIFAAGNAAANIVIGLFLGHGPHLLFLFSQIGYRYCARLFAVSFIFVKYIFIGILLLTFCVISSIITFVE